MNETQVYEAVTRVFRATFEREDIDVSATTTASDIEEWDSLNHVQLILAVETEFGIRFKPVEVAGFENVGDMVTAILRQKKS